MKNHLLKILFLLAFASCLDIILAQDYTDNSVLSEGAIYKIGVVEDGMYRISYADMAAAGIDVNALNPNKISLFGNVPDMLGEANNSSTYDDLSEIDIMVNEDGVVFYGQSPVTWIWDSQTFTYNTNYYSDTSFYFLKIDNQQDGKRMIAKEQPSGTISEVVTTFLDKQYHETDLHNYYHRGRKWYGETADGDNPTVTIPFLFKNADFTKPGYIQTRFIGASRTENFKVMFKINDAQVGSVVDIKKVGDYSFGVEKDLVSSFRVRSDELDVTMELIAVNSSTFVGLDYVGLNIWRSLTYVDEQLQFPVLASDGSDLQLVTIDNISPDMIVVDVTEPLTPKIQDFDIVDDKIQYAVNGAMPASYVLYKESDLKSIKSIRQIGNQNVHSVFSADMLIITHKIFAEQAEELKAFHEEEDGLLSEIVFVDEIFNEFSSGAHDVTAIRNFIRMVYKRSPDLKYVLLLGRGTNDYKNVEGYDNNFVPPYEALNVVNEINAYVTDDYYGLMDDNEGDECYGWMDLGVGRIPVVDADEAEIVVNKIKGYVNSVKNMGRWRNNILLFADDNKEYSKGCDALCDIVTALKPVFNVDKVYSDAYIRQKMSSGAYYYPEVTSSLLEKFDEGIMLLNYYGHGGVKGLSNSNLLRITDIDKMNNRYRLPFVSTGTCEFSAFDDASFVSAGEIMFKMENGGAIAMYTTTRPTTSALNYRIIKSLYRHILTEDNMRTLRFGDIVRLTKADNESNTTNFLSYVFYGDPALRFTYPQKDIVIDNIIADNYDGNTAIVAPMDSVTVIGHILAEDGSVAEDFNGVVYPKMFDNESTYHTLNNSNTSGNVYEFTLYNDVVYEGKASVVNGRFSFTYLVPRAVNNQDGMARLSLYAVDTLNVTDANGFADNIKVGGTSAMPLDNEGPEIEMYWDGKLNANIHDRQGIYHYNTTLGRNMVLTIESEESCNTMIVNKFFEQAVDDYTRGVLSMELDLAEGRNILTLKAWDTHDNSNSATIIVDIARTNDKTIKNVFNYPNPFSDGTCFTVEYDKLSVTADVVIEIYNVAGCKVNTLSYNGLTTPYLHMEWDGCDNGGRPLQSGIYLYKVYLNDSEGNGYNTTQRMIIMR